MQEKGDDDNQGFFLLQVYHANFVRKDWFVPGLVMQTLTRALSVTVLKAHPLNVLFWKYVVTTFCYR